MRRTAIQTRALRLAAGWFLITAALGLGGCLFAGSGGDYDPLSGRWSGEWIRAGSAGDRGKLIFQIDPVSEGRWHVRGDIRSTVEIVFEVEVAGRSNGSNLELEGQCDLGKAAGGVYQWKAESNGADLIGTWSTSTDEGRFELSRKSAAPADAPPSGGR